MNVVHVIERLGRGGASRSLLALAQRTRRAHGGEEAVVSLLPPETDAVRRAHAGGIGLIATDRDAVRGALRRADLVHVHFWNTPELYAWLRSRLPPMRLLLTLHVAGEHPAQVVTRPLLDLADVVVATTAYSLDLPVLRAFVESRRSGDVVVLPGAYEPAAIPPAAQPRGGGIDVGYIGTVGFVKMHPRFVELSAAARLDAARVVVAGGGDAGRTLERQAAAHGIGDRFRWLGWVGDVGPVLSRLATLGYPLRADSYATSDLSVQEAMAAAVPPVVLNHGALPHLVQHRETGLVVGEDDYPTALERLHRDPGERRRLGANARAHALAVLGADNLAPRLRAVYERALEQPKRERDWHGQPPSQHRGAAAFVDALGDRATSFRASLDGDDDGARQAEEWIAAASPVVTDAAAGGVLHYRRAYPDDPYLRLWAGLVLEGKGRAALAAAEYVRARDLGLACARLQGYLQRALRQAR